MQTGKNPGIAAQLPKLISEFISLDDREAERRERDRHHVTADAGGNEQLLVVPYRTGFSSAAAPRVIRRDRVPAGTRGACRIAARQALARRLASHDAGRSPLGAPPRRFWASGPRFRLLGRPPSYNGGQLPSGSVQRAPRSQVVVPGGRGPGPPEANGHKPPPQDATPRSAFRMSPETPLDEQGWEAL